MVTQVRNTSHQTTITNNICMNNQPTRKMGDQNMSQDKIIEHEKAGTPTDVRDVHF